MRYLNFRTLALIGGLLLFSACENKLLQPEPIAPPTLGSVPAVNLNFRFESDVPAPATDPAKVSFDERDPAIQAAFDTNRPLELLVRTISSPDKKRILAVYHRISDYPSEYRLDMYSPDGTLLKKMTSDTMAVHFPDTIVWSPDSSSVAFVAMIRIDQPAPILDPTATPGVSNPVANSQLPPTANANTDPEEPVADLTDPAPDAAPTPAAPTGILTYRTEQIYISTADGTGVKALTENEGLIYFYYAWSPDSSMLVALAATSREWKYLEIVAGTKDEMMVPQGRLRVIELNGRERRLDDNLTPVRPVWSPDSTKIASAFDTQIRIYDAIGTNATQAAIPLRNQLLISSQAYDREQQRLSQASNSDIDSNSEATPQPTPDQPLSTLPDEKLLVSYNPIVEIAWTTDELIYLQTAYLRRMKSEADSVRSFSRWHRLALSAQTAAPVR